MDPTTPSHSRLAEFLEKMRQENLPDAAIDLFAHYYRQLETSTAATIPESSITPILTNDIEDAADVQRCSATGIGALKKTAVVKLNGGLGTSMGLMGPKSLIKVKNGFSFLDISMRQIHHMNESLNVAVPLLIMNSFFTETATRETLALNRGTPFGRVETFLQHKFPKVLVETLGPSHCPDRPLLEWNPAGHGDLLLSLETSGLLDRLLQKGITFLFVSNIDNLGAEIDTGILGFFASEKMDFLMEVTDRTPMDRKGGHLAYLDGNGLVLREAAQCSDADRRHFSDISRHRFFNTNNLWLNLESVRKAIDGRKYKNMPMVINRKKLNPLDDNSPPVYHLESALGSAIQLFEKGGAIRVPRTRFAPVKNCDELLLMWSDYFQMQPDFRIIANPARISEKVLLTLDPAFYSRIDLLESHFPSGAPSLVDCSSLSVTGDVRFGSAVSLHGSVSITNTTGRQATIKNNTVISDDLVF